MGVLMLLPYTTENILMTRSKLSLTIPTLTYIYMQLLLP